MMKNIEVQHNGGVSKSSNLFAGKERVDEALGVLKIEDNGDDTGGAYGAVCFPDRPGEPDCIYYLRTGKCGYGSRCRFNHPSYSSQGHQNSGVLPEREGKPECRHYIRTGICKFGSACRYHHPQDRHNSDPLLLNIWGFPMRKDEKPCPYYMRTRSTAYGSTTLAFMTSSSIPYVGGVSDLSIPKTNSIINPSVQGSQSYMPLYLSPFQCWSTYMGTMGGSSILDDLADQTFGGQIPLLSSSSHQPDRPDQPECHDFVNTGSCKYGADCKYYHPRNKVAPTTSNLLGPLGLPLRPGQAVCSYYAMHGLCRYGPTCKYDHPLAGYVGVPSLVFNTSVVPYQWNSPTVPSTETSPSMSSKLPDLSRSSEVTMQKGQNSNTEKLLHIGAPPSTSQRPLEVQQDESD
ncbi:zinc finger CCCH domain-containing protein 3 isoform X2 [Coffea arabica]|uniref:Zinc finger CCCH domain-containing protein 3 isoform X2 n=1 Tax=Coffea arabica TaxID=13443 RepID=A0A6P6SA89_COFAR